MNSANHPAGPQPQLFTVDELHLMVSPKSPWSPMSDTPTWKSPQWEAGWFKLGFHSATVKDGVRPWNLRAYQTEGFRQWLLFVKHILASKIWFKTNQISPNRHTHTWINVRSPSECWRRRLRLQYGAFKNNSKIDQDQIFGYGFISVLSFLWVMILCNKIETPQEQTRAITLPT